jgi:hypothetical protein
MTPFEYISTHVYTKLKPSKIQGVGLFSIKEIPENTYPFETWKGETGSYPIKEEQLKTLPKELYNHIKDIFLYSPDFPKDTDTYVFLVNGLHWIHQNPYYFINCGVNVFNIDKTTLKTTKIIKVGEELLSNYKRYERYDRKDLI